MTKSINKQSKIRTAKTGKVKRKADNKDSQLTIVNPYTAGIDVASREHWYVCPLIVLTIMPRNSEH